MSCFKFVTNYFRLEQWFGTSDENYSKWITGSYGPKRVRSERFLKNDIWQLFKHSVDEGVLNVRVTKLTVVVLLEIFAITKLKPKFLFWTSAQELLLIFKRIFSRNAFLYRVRRRNRNQIERKDSSLEFNVFLTQIILFVGYFD